MDYIYKMEMRLHYYGLAVLCIRPKVFGIGKSRSQRSERITEVCPKLTEKGFVALGHTHLSF